MGGILALCASGLLGGLGRLLLVVSKALAGRG